MPSGRMKVTFWVLGLEPEDSQHIEFTAGQGYQCVSLDNKSLDEIYSLVTQTREDSPLLFWIGGQTWLNIRAKNPRLAVALKGIPTVLVLENRPSRELLELALDAPVQQVMRSPFSSAQVFDALSRALEVHNIYSDMNRMAREISLEREMLERKTDICSFLFQFFSSTGENSTACGVAANSAQVLNEYCGLEGLHIAWWGDTEQITYILGVDPTAGNENAWRGFMREQAARLHPSGQDAKVLHWDGNSKGPDMGKSLLLPLVIRGRTCGVMALHLTQPILHSRDMAQALDVARKHLALALWEGSSSEGYFGLVSDPRLEALYDQNMGAVQ